MVAKWPKINKYLYKTVKRAVVIASPSPFDAWNYGRMNKHPKKWQKVESRLCPTMTT